MRIHQVSRVLGPLALLLAVPALGTTPATAAPEPQPVTDAQCIDNGGLPTEITTNGGDYDYDICKGGKYDGLIVIVPDDDNDGIWP
ncbi:hypothetical protein [Streptomyces luteireticuli]|uniref:hypothetical protein n=1 Tax=Streptomyces luteireticuli TaxID=173858 RepID=UPI0035564721